MPIPSGEGAVGMWLVGNIIENIGSCLDGAMQPGATYDLSMYIGFNENDSYGSPLNISDIECNEETASITIEGNNE